MGNEQVVLGAARAIARSSISEHYELMRELVEKNNVALVKELCDRSPESRMNTSEPILLGGLPHIAHRPLLLDKVVSSKMLEAVLPDHVPTGQQQLQEREELASRIAGSALVENILGNNESGIPAAERGPMLGTLLRRTGVKVEQPSLENLLTGDSAVKSQLLVQLVKHGSVGTRKNLLFAAMNCPDEEMQETIVDELLTQSVPLEETELEKFGGASVRSREMLERAVAAGQLVLPKGAGLAFDSPDLR